MAANALGIAMGSIGNPEEREEDDSEIRRPGGQEDDSCEEKGHSGEKGRSFHGRVNLD